MSIEQVLGRCAEQAAVADASGRWDAWACAQPTLGELGSAAALVDVVRDRQQPGRANQLLLALVRAGSADGGVDEAAATFVASLLAPGANRIIRSLSSLGPEVGDIVAGQLWLQVRDYPWRAKPRAVAKNILMDTRRAVLRDYGASTYRRATLVPLATPDEASTADHALEVQYEQQVPDLALLQMLVWATAWRVLRRDDAALLWDLVLVDVQLAADPEPRVRQRPGHGAGSELGAATLAAARGMTSRHLRRRRDHAVSALRDASEKFRSDFDIGLAVGAATPAPASTRGETARRLQHVTANPTSERPRSRPTRTPGKGNQP